MLANDAGRTLRDLERVTWEKIPKRRPQTPEVIQENTDRLALVRGSVTMARTCARCGRQPAVLGSPWCRHHGGGSALGRRPDKDRPPASLVVRLVKRLERNGQLPAGLVAHPAWVAAWSKRKANARILQDLVIAWTRKEESGDAQAWIQALTRARAAGLSW